MTVRKGSTCGALRLTPQDEVSILKKRLKLTLEVAAGVREQLREAQQRARKERTR